MVTQKRDFKIRYTNLPAFLFSKDYTFEVMARNDAGVWLTAPLRFTFPVRPPLWLRWWACLAYVALILFGAHIANRFRTRHLKRKNRALEDLSWLGTPRRSGRRRGSWRRSMRSSGSSTGRWCSRTSKRHCSNRG